MPRGKCRLTFTLGYLEGGFSALNRESFSQPPAFISGRATGTPWLLSEGVSRRTVFRVEVTPSFPLHHISGLPFLNLARPNTLSQVVFLVSPFPPNTNCPPSFPSYAYKYSCNIIDSILASSPEKFPVSLLLGSFSRNLRIGVVGTSKRRDPPPPPPKPLPLQRSSFFIFLPVFLSMHNRWLTSTSAARSSMTLSILFSHGPTQTDFVPCSPSRAAMVFWNPPTTTPHTHSVRGVAWCVKFTVPSWMQTSGALHDNRALFSLLE